MNCLYSLLLLAIFFPVHLNFAQTGANHNKGRHQPDSASLEMGSPRGAEEEQDEGQEEGKAAEEELHAAVEADFLQEQATPASPIVPVQSLWSQRITM
uniref:Uncharacterized protein n=1 Tax=Ditylenchus dipsaci TaxID=166011 RepID=A0A915D689_9BILA